MKALFKLFLYSLLFQSSLSAANGIDHPKVKWSFKTQGPIRSGAVVTENKLYVGSADGFLYALNKVDGKLQWKFESQGAIAGSPALVDNMIIFSSRDNHVYAVHATSGELIWKFQMQPILEAYTTWEYFTPAPVISGTLVYVGSGDGNLYALNTKDGKVKWKYEVGARIRATPLLTGEVIYQPANDGVVYVLSANEGRLLWDFRTEGASLDKSAGFDRTCIFTKPSLKDNLLVFGSRDGRTYAVDIITHKAKWSFTYGSTWAMSTAVDNETVFAGWSTNNTFCAIDLKTGHEKWKYQCGSVIYSTAVIRDDQVIFGSADGNLYSLYKDTGKKVWQYNVGSEIHASPVYDGNTIYFGSDNGYLYALEEGIKPQLAVYQPIMANGNMGYPVLDPKIAPYLVNQGFQQLDSAKLYNFIKARIEDKLPSVVVFAYDAIPPNIIGEHPDKGMIRQYLDGGGKIIWFGWVPNLFAFDSKGRGSYKQDITLATRMLGVDFISPEESGNYYCKATQEGMNAGFPQWFKTTNAVVAGEQVTPLAIDEYNRVSAWMKKFNSRPGSGFISFRTWAWDVPIKEEDLKLIRHVAIYELE